MNGNCTAILTPSPIQLFHHVAHNRQVIMKIPTSIAIFLFPLLGTSALACTYNDACNGNSISAPPGGLLTDSCHNVWRVDASCRLSYLTTTTTWMSRLHNHAFHSLAVPGSHDSAAYKTEYFVYPAARHWALAQKKTIYEQLKAGIRFLDIRLRKDDGVIMTAHRYYMVPFSTVADDIKRFVHDHPSEVVAVEITNERSADDDEKLSSQQINSLAHTSFASRLHYGSTSATLGSLVSQSKNIIVNPSRSWDWLDVQYGGQLCTKLRAFSRPSTSLSVIAMAITPNTNSIINGQTIGTHRSLSSATAAVKPAVLWKFIRAQAAPAHAGHIKSNSVYLHDFVDSETVAHVLDLNHASRPSTSFT